MKMPKHMRIDLLKIFSSDDIVYIEHGKTINNTIIPKKENSTLHENMISLPYYPDGYASAGGGAYPYLYETEPMSFSKSFLELHLGIMDYKNIFILNTTGESMEPTLKNGSLIFINPIENEGFKVRDGGVYVVMCDDTILVKRVSFNPMDKTYTLISDNPLHGSIKIEMFEESGCKFMGRVVGSFDRI